MAFLDNSGDIILDAVLTDAGRKTLSKGDGSFQITKFALGDDEVDYSLYNKTHPSGSAYYDLEILQTPILEAFTDNAASVLSRLQTYTDLELLFLPVVLLNEKEDLKFQRATSGTFFVAVNSETEDNDGSASTKTGVGRDTEGTVRRGFMLGETLVGSLCVVDQGLNTDQISPERNLSTELMETSYILSMDNRLGNIVSESGESISFDYIDDDNIAYYTLDMKSPFVKKITDTTKSDSMIIDGPRGTRVMFRVASSTELRTSSYLFTTLGAEQSLDNRGGTTSTVLYIDTVIRITGAKTGARIDVPFRYVRLQ